MQHLIIKALDMMITTITSMINRKITMNHPNPRT